MQISNYVLNLRLNERPPIILKPGWHFCVWAAICHGIKNILAISALDILVVTQSRGIDPLTLITMAWGAILQICSRTLRGNPFSRGGSSIPGTALK